MWYTDLLSGIPPTPDSTPVLHPPPSTLFLSLTVLSPTASVPLYHTCVCTYYVHRKCEAESQRADGERKAVGKQVELNFTGQGRAEYYSKRLLSFVQISVLWSKVYSRVSSTINFKNLTPISFSP